MFDSPSSQLLAQNNLDNLLGVLSLTQLASNGRGQLNSLNMVVPPLWPVATESWERRGLPGHQGSGSSLKVSCKRSQVGLCAEIPLQRRRPRGDVSWPSCLVALFAQAHRSNLHVSLTLGKLGHSFLRRVIDSSGDPFSARWRIIARGGRAVLMNLNTRSDVTLQGWPFKGRLKGNPSRLHLRAPLPSPSKHP